MFLLSKNKTPAGDQPKAIKALSEGLKKNKKQTLLGVTGSGKTYTIANVIKNNKKPALIIAHNKTLAAQLVQEYKELFPKNKVCYFVSYYDYYQPEAYVPTSDTYIEKEAQINQEIDRLRHETTQALLTRNDVIVVASVSAIYGLGSPKKYKEMHLHLSVGKKISREEVMKKIISIYYERVSGDLKSGQFRVTGQNIEIMPVNDEVVYRIVFDSQTKLSSKSTSVEKIEKIEIIDPNSRTLLGEEKDYFLFPAKHFVSDKKEREKILKQIEKEMKVHVAKLGELESERLRRRTLQDISLIREIGYCSGIENYSRYFDGRVGGEAPNTLLSYFPKNFLTVIDESHVTLPQLAGMYSGDKARKETLIAHGFRLPSALDNRPLRYEEFNKNIDKVIYVSATPGDVERKEKIVEQIIRPTGLLDPKLKVSPAKTQIVNFIKEAKEEIKNNGQILATTLTKKNAEELSQYLKDNGLNAEYMHSDIKTIERVELLNEFRKGKFDILVGVNLLREGLDLPEVTLVAIFSADKEGFLRNETSLIQTIGRAARNVEGRVLLYADKITNSLKHAIDETNRRRKIQEEHNKKNKITPKTIEKNLTSIVDEIEARKKRTAERLSHIDSGFSKKQAKSMIKEKEKQMKECVKELDFETASILRDEIKILTEKYKK